MVMATQPPQVVFPDTWTGTPRRAGAGEPGLLIRCELHRVTSWTVSVSIRHQLAAFLPNRDYSVFVTVCLFPCLYRPLVHGSHPNRDYFHVPNPVSRSGRFLISAEAPLDPGWIGGFASASTGRDAAGTPWQPSCCPSELCRRGRLLVKTEERVR